MPQQLLPIILGTARRPGGVSAFSDTLPAELKQQILERDSHSCRFCGFQSARYQEVHFLNGDFNDTKPDNLATSCLFCNQCFDLEKTSQMRSGVLIWLPEIEQAELNHIARAIYVARISQGSMADIARSALDQLMKRREEAKTRLSTDDPYLLSIVMRDFLGPQHYARRKEKLEGIRLFPLDRRIIKEGDLEFNQFPQILAYWRSKDGPFGARPPQKWKTLYAKMQQQDAA